MASLRKVGRARGRRAINELADGASELRSALADPSLLLWSLYILLFPVYVGPSGLPQPGEAVAIFLTVSVYRRWNGKLGPHSLRALRSVGAFLLYATLVNVVWTAVTGSIALNLKDGFLLSPVFYAYNVVIFALGLLMYQRYGERFLWVTIKMVLLAVLIQVAISFVMRGGGTRSKVLFNNPNQLGYYAILSASLLFLGQVRGWLSTMQAVVGTVACTYLALISASKAALVCIVLVIAIGMLSRIRTIIVTALVFGAFVLVVEPYTHVIERATNRVQNDETAGFFEERGYDRITQHPEYWLLGSGEGGYRRYAGLSVIGSHELHSSAGTLFFCYGIVGTLLFLSFMGRVIIGAGLQTALLLVPAAAYGLSHQGMRFTLLWVLMACIVAIKEARRQTRIDALAARHAQDAALATPA